MATTPVELLGGEKILGRRVSSSMGMIDALRRGLPYSSLAAVMQAMGLSRQEASRVLSLPLRTLDRRKKERRLQADESDRLYRLANIAARAVEVLGSPYHAALWLRHPNRALGGAVPIELLDTELGAEQVEQILGRIEHGVYS